ncbi:hypothetical protein HHL28_11820 [Aerophototrophica crusticola]|uniref:DUF4258 domain-containing protein n=1 Tax=Aerophototrophica crusticola TaxID=1709002 RepID=A0A858R9M8_9PROT|nr:hypothetical protein HHL28_11820 [Rhodospirillaceae bacterium B3]
MDRKKAEAHIRFLAEVDRIALTAHAMVRNPGAGKQPLTREQIKRCLIHGSVVEGPVPDLREPNGWKFTMRRFRTGEAHEVAGVLVVERKILVITGYEWVKPGRA